MTALVEDHHLVLLRASAELFARALRESFDEHVEHTVLVLLVLLGRDFGLQGDEFVQSAQFHLFGNVVGQVFRGVGSGTLRVLEHEGRVVAHLTHQRETELIVFLGLRMIAYEDVGRQGAVGNDTPNGGHAVQVPLTGVFAVHQLQYSVATALHGQVDMLAHVRLLGNHPQRLVAHVLGMAGGEADAHARSLVGNEAKQFWKKYLLEGI